MQEQEAFNPYREWLGLQMSSPPSNYYELLGVAAFESDPAVIAHRAELATSRVRGARPGPRIAEWQQMLSVIGGARDCLLDPASKAAYDARLRSQSVARPVRAVSSAPVAIGLPAIRRNHSAVGARWTKAKQTIFPMFGVMAAAAAVVVAAAFYYQARQREIAENRAANAPRADRSARGKGPGTAIAAVAAAQGRHAERRERVPASDPDRQAQPAAQPREAKRPTARPSPDTSLMALAAAEVKPGDDSSSSDASAPEKPEGTAGAQGTAQVDPQKQEVYKRTVAAVRAAMARRDAASANRDVRAAAKLIQTPEEEVEINRLATLTSHLDEFWKTIAQVVAGLTPAQELNLGKTLAIVVETNPNRVTLRCEGRNLSFSVKELPRPVVEALVQSGFADNAATRVLLGTYLAMDAQGDRQAARRVWQEATDAGQDIKELMAELDVASPGKTPANPTPGNTGAAKTDAPTDRAAIQQAEQAVRAQFEVDYNLASGISGKLKLSEKLAAAAGGANVPTEKRFVMLRDARDYALAAGKAGAACDVIDQMARYFTVAPLEMKTAAVEQAAKMARTSASNREAAECALGLVDQALQARRWDEAGRLAAVALSTAQKTRNAAMVRSAREAKLKVDDTVERAGGGGQDKRGHK